MPTKLTTLTVRDGERRVALRALETGLGYRMSAAERKALRRVYERLNASEPDYLVRFAVSRSCLQNFLIPAIAIASKNIEKEFTGRTLVADIPAGQAEGERITVHASEYRTKEISAQKTRRVRAAIAEAREKIGGSKWGQLPVGERDE